MAINHGSWISIKIAISQTLTHLFDTQFYSIMSNLNPVPEYEIYRIGDAHDNYAVSLAPKNSIYDGSNSYRKSHPLPSILRQFRNNFIDDSFQIQIRESDTNDKRQRFVLRRLYQIYDKQIDLFQPELMQDLPLKPRKFYPTFLSQFSMIDNTYLQTLFFTKKLNEKGLYKYFVRRNGEYYVQAIDDMIPVDPETRLPPWGLSQFQPWKIIVMKAWLKEKRSISNMVNAQPYQFIEAFGFPGYRALSIKKQLNHIAVSQLSQTSKAAKSQRIPLDVPGFIVVGKTRNNAQVIEMGLVPNRAGYRIFKTKYDNQNILQSSIMDIKNKELLKQNVYKVHSSLPSAWVGQFSIFANGKIHSPQYSTLYQDITHIENEFFASYQQLSQVFSKFYIVPEYSSNKLQGNLVQDSCHIVYHPKEYYVFELRIQSSGFINLNIELPYDSAQVKKENGKQSRRYSYIKYFMAKKEVQNSAQLKSYSYYDGQYVKGYHKSCNRFLQIEPGTYYIYFKIQPNYNLHQGQYLAININSNARVLSFAKVNPEKVNFPLIMQSTLHNYNVRYGLKTYADRKSSQRTKPLVVYTSNSFDEIGFGVISIAAKVPTEMMLAMNIHLEQFKAKNIGICIQSQAREPEVKKASINVVVKQGEAKTVVFQRLSRSRQTHERFPPAEAVDFYHII